MADGTTVTFDTSSFTAGIEKLRGSTRESLARSMAVAAGQVFRDEAKVRAPVETGVLRDSIYLAYREAQSSAKVVTYSVTWNGTKAPHGHLLEFGHWSKSGKRPRRGAADNRPNIRWVPAHPFIRPALDSAGPRAVAAAISRGQERLPELLSGQDAEISE